MMGAKIGIARVAPEDASLIADLLALMQQHALDYTNTFVELTRALDESAGTTALPSALDPWLLRWKARLDRTTSREDASVLMRRANPLVIPRNHHVEAALAAVAERGDTGPVERLLAVLRDPYYAGSETAAYTDPPPGGDRGYQTFCVT
jgi:uncharacterized protein YdiU (UPF0061 family)